MKQRTMSGPWVQLIKIIHVFGVITPMFHSRRTERNYMQSLFPSPLLRDPLISNVSV